MLERFQQERLAEEGDRRRGPKKAEDVRVSSNGKWTDMVSWTRHEARGKGVETKESTREEGDIEAEEKE